eukprot:1339900-Rhodomonas_salina.1
MLIIEDGACGTRMIGCSTAGTHESVPVLPYARPQYRPMPKPVPHYALPQYDLPQYHRTAMPVPLPLCSTTSRKTTNVQQVEKRKKETCKMGRKTCPPDPAVLGRYCQAYCFLARPPDWPGLHVMLRQYRTSRRAREGRQLRQYRASRRARVGR